MLDLAMCLGVVRAILHHIDLAGAHRERHEVTFAACTGDEDLRRIGGADEPRHGALRDVDSLRLAIPHIDTPVADGAEGNAFHLDIDGARGRHHAGFVLRHAILECLPAPELDDVEIVERHARIIHIDDGRVAVVEGRNVHLDQILSVTQALGEGE